MDEDKLVTSMKFNKILLNEIEDNKINKIMMSGTDIKNCLVRHCSSNIFNLSSSIKGSMSLIERCFPMIVDSDNFLELDFISNKKILSSGGLNIDSELQVFNAADSWLSHDITQRSKYAKDLLSMVRLPLLSIPALKQVLNRVSSKYHKCANTIEAVLVKKQQVHPFSCNITSRYCNQNNFNILVCGGYNDKLEKHSNGAKLFNANYYSEVINLPNMNEVRSDFKAVCVKGEVYVFGGNDNDRVIRSVEKYSTDSNTWENVTNMIDDRYHFSVCSLIDNVYIIGGRMDDVIDGHNIATCFEFNTKSLEWNEISKMINPRKLSASSVFEGRIVVSGGWFNNRLNTVEAYDHVRNTWENMPNMINVRYCHKSVAVKNKLFVVGGLSTSNCEVFDSTTNKFTVLKQPTLASRYDLYESFGVNNIGSKIFIFKDNSDVITYDFESNEWSVKACKATKNIRFFSCVKIPVMKNDKKTQLKKKREIFFLLFALIFSTCIVLVFYR